MLKLIVQCMTALGLALSLTACYDAGLYPPVDVTDYNPPTASSSMNYGPPPQNHPAVTVTNGNNAANSMNYGPPPAAAASMHYGPSSTT